MRPYKHKRDEDVRVTEKPKKIKFDDWVSATATRAYLLKDPILDWFKVTSKSFIPRSNSMSFTPFIMEKGNEFEEHVDEFIKKKFAGNYVDIGGTFANCRSEQHFNMTVDAIKKNIPIIISGVLFDTELKLYGIPDLIVRSDWLHKLVDNPPAINKKCYVIVDIKFTTLKLRCDGIHLLNEGMVPAHKGQTYIYNKILSKIQNHDPQKAFLLGRRWKYTSRGETYCGNSCFDKLATIDFVENDKIYVEETQRAIEWVRNVRENGRSWNPLDCSNPNLFPNMANSYDFPWRSKKEELANEIGEITKLWMCGVKNRKVAHRQNVLSWTDPKCNTNVLGIYKGVSKKIIDQMIQLNRNEEHLIIPSKILNNSNKWKEQSSTDMFVDFETINDVIATDFKELPLCKPMNIIYMIGVGFVENGKWKHVSFVVDEISEEAENKICDEFYKFVGNNRLFHWTSAEVSSWNRMMKRRNKNMILNWVDMFPVFKKEPILIKGVFNFSLKQIAKKMYEYGMIDTTWDTQCTDGASAMVACVLAKDEAKKQNIPLSETESMNDARRYNEIDCKTIFEIVTYLRTHHI